MEIDGAFKPQLVALSGPGRGMTAELTEGTFVAGRHTSNAICIPDQSVSRRHFEISFSSGQVILKDLNSRNGTFVNGLPVKNKTLEHRDVIEVGDTQLILLLRTPPAPPATGSVSVVEGERAQDDATMTRLPVVPAGPIVQETPGRGHSTSTRQAHDLDVLLKINNALNWIRELAPLERQLLTMIFEVIPAEKGAILLGDNGAGEFQSAFGLWRGQSSQCRVEVSRTVLQKARRDGFAVLLNSSTDRHLLSDSTSLFHSKASSVLCAPLMEADRMTGVIYLETSNPQAQFDGDHLALLTGIAGVAAGALQNVRQMEELEKENRQLIEAMRVQHNMVGESPRMEQVHSFVAKVAATDSTVLIKGESGTGKELVARAIHYLGKRAPHPFVALNCAAIPESMLEAELFGHERGAFTGAVALKRGKLEAAHGGTLFLDEIGEMDPALQAKLLRVLQSREFERLGGTSTVKVDIRIIAATNRNLEEATQAGAFRQDLYFRINVVSITLPPLRDRREDIPLLASYFVSKFSKQCGRRVRGMSPQAMEALMRYDWPGNIRELENAIERAIVMGSGGPIQLEDLPETLLETESTREAGTPRFHEAVQQAKRNLILEALRESQGNFTEAARRLGLHPNYLHRLVRNLNLREALQARSGTL